MPHAICPDQNENLFTLFQFFWTSCVKISWVLLSAQTCSAGLPCLYCQHFSCMSCLWAINFRFHKTIFRIGNIWIMSWCFRYEEEKQPNGMAYFDKVSTSKCWAHHKVVGLTRVVGVGWCGWVIKFLTPILLQHRNNIIKTKLLNTEFRPFKFYWLNPSRIKVNNRRYHSRTGKVRNFIHSESETKTLPTKNSLI